MYAVSRRKSLTSNLLEFFAAVLTLVFDLEFCMLCLFAKDKFEVQRTFLLFR